MQFNNSDDLDLTESQNFIKTLKSQLPLGYRRINFKSIFCGIKILQTKGNVT